MTEADDCAALAAFQAANQRSAYEGGDLERELAGLAAYHAGAFCGAVSGAHGLDAALIAHALFLLIEEATRRREQWLAAQRGHYDRG